MNNLHKNNRKCLNIEHVQIINVEEFDWRTDEAVKALELLGCWNNRSLSHVANKIAVDEKST